MYFDSYDEYLDYQEWEGEFAQSLQEAHDRAQQEEEEHQQYLDWCWENGIYELPHCYYLDFEPDHTWQESIKTSINVL